jgi:hypothetical protein
MGYSKRSIEHKNPHYSDGVDEGQHGSIQLSLRRPVLLAVNGLASNSEGRMNSHHNGALRVLFSSTVTPWCLLPLIGFVGFQRQWGL